MLDVVPERNEADVNRQSRRLSKGAKGSHDRVLVLLFGELSLLHNIIELALLHLLCEDQVEVVLLLPHHVSSLRIDLGRANITILISYVCTQHAVILGALL